MEASEAYALTITPSLCDFDGKLSIPDCFSVFQDIAADHAERLGVGADAMFNRGLFWLTVKTKIHFLRRPAMPETVTVSTRPLAPEKVRSIREYRLTAGDELLAEGKTEWTVIETASGKIHPMADVFDPALELGREAGYTAPFCRIGPRFAPEERLGTYTVRSVDIDFGGHMNNVAYVRTALHRGAADRPAERGGDRLPKPLLRGRDPDRLLPQAGRRLGARSDQARRHARRIGADGVRRTDAICFFPITKTRSRNRLLVFVIGILCGCLSE